MCVCVVSNSFRNEFSFYFSSRMNNLPTCVSTGTIGRQPSDRDAVHIDVEPHVLIGMLHTYVKKSRLSLKQLVSFVSCESSDCGQ